jgi:hypothetical protein
MSVYAKRLGVFIDTFFKEVCFFSFGGRWRSSEGTGWPHHHTFQAAGGKPMNVHTNTVNGIASRAKSCSMLHK